jgi:hypothetical protein
MLATHSVSPWRFRKYLESSAQTEDTVVGFLGSETLEGGLNDIVFLGE